MTGRSTEAMHVKSKQATVLSRKTMNVSIPTTKDMLVTTAIPVTSHTITK